MAVSDTAALRPRARPWRVNGRGILWLAAPSAVWYMLFTIGPLLAMFYIALLDWKGLAAKPGWAGLANITRMFSDPRIGTAAINTAVHLVATLPAMMVLSFMLGYFLNLKLPGHRVFRVIMFIPALISVSSLGMMFIAVLGLLGGFLTPILLSSGQNQPIPLFSYLLLLNVGLAWVAYKKRWPALTVLSAIGSNPARRSFT